MIDIYDAQIYEDTIYCAAKAALYFFEIKEDEVDIEIGLISKEEMQALNSESRGINAVTDVLSFPNLHILLPFNKLDYKSEINPETGGVILGEIYICLDRALEQALQYNHSIEREISFLVVHGLLHLLAFDHKDEQTSREMESIQERILIDIGQKRQSVNGPIAAINQLEGASTNQMENDLQAENNIQVEDNMQENDEPKTELDVSISMEKDAIFKCGYIAVLGRPNSGKSTLINRFVGHKVSIVSWKPQTTRNRILGIRNDEDTQIIFVDTPGLHKPKNELGKFMMRSVTSALNDADALIYIINAEKEFFKSDKDLIRKYLDAGEKVIVVINKIDRVEPKSVARMLTSLSSFEELSAVVPISALRGKNIAPLLKEIKKILPYGEPIYPNDIYTDRSMRFVVTEIIREKALKLLEEEIPYGVAVTINKYEEKGDSLVVIDANLIIQKRGHKGIVLGKNGAMIKQISTNAREDIEKITQTKVFLTLWVKVEKDWREDAYLLNKLGYNKTDYKQD